MDDIAKIQIRSIWAVKPIEERPQLVLANWCVFEVYPEKTRHFVGYNETDREGRVSSAIQSFDPASGKGVTASGRIYELIGDPGRDPDGMYVWGRWLQIPGQGVTSHNDVTSEVWNEMLQARGQVSTTRNK